MVTHRCVASLLQDREVSHCELHFSFITDSTLVDSIPILPYYKLDLSTVYSNSDQYPGGSPASTDFSDC